MTTDSSLVTMMQTATRVQAAARALSVNWATKKPSGDRDWPKKTKESEIFCSSPTFIARVDILRRRREKKPGDGA